jgi:hypothetical protein
MTISTAKTELWKGNSYIVMIPYNKETIKIKGQTSLIEFLDFYNYYVKIIMYK